MSRDLDSANRNPPLRSILKKPPDCSINSVDWELAFGRANTFTGGRSLERRRRRRRSEKGASRPNSIVSVPSVVSIGSQSSSGSKEKMRGNVSARGKRKQNKKYHTKSEGRRKEETVLERITSPISYKNTPLPSIQRVKSGKIDNCRENGEKRGEKKRVEEGKRGEGKKGDKRSSVKGGSEKKTSLRDGGTTYRVIPMSDITRLAEERKTKSTVEVRLYHGTFIVYSLISHFTFHTVQSPDLLIPHLHPTFELLLNNEA